jgi:uncharacterized membrane protein YgaE (UPF0421/DUF939 family)
MKGETLTLQLAVKMALAAAVGLGVAQALGLPYPEYAVLAAATVTDDHAGSSVVLGILRMVGSLVGVVLSVLLVEVTGVSAWSIGLACLAGVGICVLVRSTAAARLSVIVLGVGTLGIVDRVEEWAGGRLPTTAAGIVVTVIVSALPWPTRLIARIAAPFRGLRWPWRLAAPFSDQKRLTRAGIVSEE